ncbi:MAG: HD domain-containing protein [Kiritimatiellia bacterium]
MNTATLRTIERRFHAYVSGFRSRTGKLPALMQLKLDHSLRVAADCAEMAEELGWKRGAVNLARVLGLLHDVGRFRQICDYGTFWDNRSTDHAELGFRIVRSAHILPDFNRHEVACLLTAVRYHNKPRLPAELESDADKLLKLLRDADKLDILLVAAATMNITHAAEHPDLVLGISRTRPPSARLIREVLKYRTAPYDRIKSLADLTLVRLAWVYHMNFSAALRRIKDRRLLERLMAGTPHAERLLCAFHEARKFVRYRLSTPSGSPIR